MLHLIKDVTYPLFWCTVVHKIPLIDPLSFRGLLCYNNHFEYDIMFLNKLKGRKNENI